ncbi:hypothetical protein M153_2734000394 [Pseudoloma neurophilia]|uniref:Uncharacterized protein n=1 Tax=Pseudoloma neurophilia TaxID=146866 RepID=A0A0R0LTM0_9MICR|nr:hypothetical protein M153_2734000394 [Pseudoloma neurophilia]
MKQIEKKEVKAAYDLFIRDLTENIDRKDFNVSENMKKLENACFDILAGLEEPHEENK